MTLRPLACSALALLALLPACKRDAAPDAAGSGQILPGSASDAMLPADRVTSQPPLDPRADRGTGSGAVDKDSGETGAPKEESMPLDAASEPSN